jgi:fibrillarin-like rRNA methylase
VQVLWNPVVATKAALAFAIMVVGIRVYKKTNKRSVLYLGIAFGYLAVTHLAILINLGERLQGFLIAVTVVAYALVLWALRRLAVSRPDRPS